MGIALTQTNTDLHNCDKIIIREVRPRSPHLLKFHIHFLSISWKKLELTLRLSLQMAYRASSSVCVSYFLSWKDFQANHSAWSSSNLRKWPYAATTKRARMRKIFILWHDTNWLAVLQCHTRHVRRYDSGNAANLFTTREVTGPSRV